MKKISIGAGLLMAAVGIVAVLSWVSGCEKSTSAGMIYITPSEVTLKGSSNTVNFVASVPTNSAEGEFFDSTLEWSVTEPALGDIIHAAGNAALYVRSPGTGVNYVFVRDAYQREGWAIVTQK